MRYLLIIILAFTLKGAYAQWLNKEPLYPNAKTVKIVGNKGYWRLLTIDSAGRVVIEESYKKGKLLARSINEYNSHNDKTHITQTFDINNPGKVSTTRYDYQYVDSIITYQKVSFDGGLSATIQLIERGGDSVVVYKVDTGDIYRLTYKNGLLQQLKHSDPNDKSVEITTYQHFANGRVKHRLYKQDPPGRIVYSGVPASDDMSYKYVYDGKGRVKKTYNIVSGKAYKTARYIYR